MPRWRELLCRVTWEQNSRRLRHTTCVCHRKTLLNQYSNSGQVTARGARLVEIMSRFQSVAAQASTLHTSPPFCVKPRPQESRTRIDLPRACTSHHVDELDSFATPSSSSIQRNYDQEAPVATHHLHILGLLVRPGSVDVSGVSLWQPVGGSGFFFDGPVIVLWDRDVHVPQLDVESNQNSRFPTDSGQGAFWSHRSPLQTT